MPRYIKNTTTYTLRKRSQGVDGGAIYERDWSTLNGQKLRFGKGKTPMYNDGNFIFTTSSFQTPSRKNKAGEIVATYNYNDVKDAKSVVNNVELNTNSNDIRTFAYYGSCVELVQSSITNIIATFPATIYTNKQQLEVSIDENGVFTYVTGAEGEILYIINNNFGIDLLSKNVTLTEYDNKYRFMCESYEDYEINGKPIIGFEVDYSFSNCKEDDQWYNFVDYRVKNTDRDAPVIVTFYDDSYDKEDEKQNGVYEFLGYKMDNDVIFLCSKDVVIKPKQEIIESYFDNLKGFEKQLLNRNTKPIYMNTFQTPVEGKQSIKYVKRNYRWPTVDDYCIDITSPSYDEFVQNLLAMATAYDELWCNNLYNKMTHEVIKNFDWTYTQEYLDGEEQDNIDGGLRMQRILYLIGRVFDETKQYIDGIKNNVKASYDNVNNVPEALLSDKLELQGWDVVSTIPIIHDNDKTNDNEPKDSVIKLNQEFIENKNLKWYGGSSYDIIDSSLHDTLFMKRLLLASKKIFSSKGTQEAIDMVMGMFGFGRNEEISQDYTLTEKFYKVKVNENITKEKINELILSRIEYYNANDSVMFPFLPLNEFTYNEIEVNQNGITSYKRGKDNERKSVSYMIPFYEKDKDYIHELYFQSKGGWGQYSENELFKEYLETISYLNVVTNVADLFNADPMTTNTYDIYYVVDLSDYTDYYESDVNIKSVSHFFYYKGNSSTYFASSWSNIHTQVSVENNSEERQLYEKAMYLNNIITSKFGNNPHCGFGYYDNGDEFKTYMAEPFKYFIDNNGYYESEVIEDLKEMKFVITEIPENNNVESKVMTEAGYSKDCYYLNSKIVVMENLVNDNKFYKKYFKDVILPYLLQVIPSTTILILKNY